MKHLTPRQNEVLELIKEQLVELVQNEPFAPIHVRARAE